MRAAPAGALSSKARLQANFAGHAAKSVPLVIALGSLPVGH